MENKSLKRVHPPAFKAKVAIEAIKGEKTLAEPLQGHDLRSFGSKDEAGYL